MGLEVCSRIEDILRYKDGFLVWEGGELRNKVSFLLLQ